MTCSRFVCTAGVMSLAGFLTVALSAQAPAADAKKANLSSDKGKEGNAQVVSMVSQAGTLVRYAQRNESVVSMLAAVDMLRRAGLSENGERTGKKEMEAGSATAKPGTKGKTPEPSFEITALLNEAKGWAKNDPHLTALVDAELAKPAPKAGATTLGASSGAIYHRDSVNPGQTDIYTVVFNGGEVARVMVLGDGDTDLDLYILDEYGNEIARDSDYTDRCVVSFTPRWTGKFKVRIRNLGRVYNRYLLVTN